jgi:hypothetical protein
VGNISNHFDSIIEELYERMIKYYNHPFYSYLLAMHPNEFYNYVAFPSYFEIIKDIPDFQNDIYKIIALQADYLSAYGLKNKELFIHKNYEFTLRQIHQRIICLKEPLEHV